jgi:hypothetical protein
MAPPAGGFLAPAVLRIGAGRSGEEDFATAFPAVFMALLSDLFAEMPGAALRVPGFREGVIAGRFEGAFEAFFEAGFFAAAFFFVAERVRRAGRAGFARRLLFPGAFFADFFRAAFFVPPMRPPFPGGEPLRPPEAGWVSAAAAAAAPAGARRAPAGRSTARRPSIEGRAGLPWRRSLIRAMNPPGTMPQTDFE